MLMTRNRRHDVAVFGATGYTGRRIVRELLAAERSVICVGRNASQLTETARSFERPVRLEVTELSDRTRLEGITRTATTVINAAGSLVETCEPIARAAIRTGTHYVDISGEQRSIAFVFDDLHDKASRAGIALIPSAGFYATLPDMLVSIAAGDIDHVGDVDIAYHITDRTPSGSAYDNFLRQTGRPVMQFDHGFVEVATQHQSTIDFGAPLGPRRAFTYPAPEVLTIPRHVNVDRIRTWMTTSTFAPQIPKRLTPFVTTALGIGLSSPAAPWMTKAMTAARGWSSTRIDDDPTTFRIEITIGCRSSIRHASAFGPAIFDITAPIAANVTALTLDESFDGVGALTPARVANPREFLDALARHGLTYTTR